MRDLAIDWDMDKILLMPGRAISVLRFYRHRVNELLEASNRYLERARAAEAELLRLATPPSPQTLVDGFELSARFVETRLNAYCAEHGGTDPDTGTVEYPGNGEEYVHELEEIIEGIRELAFAAEVNGNEPGSKAETPATCCTFDPNNDPKNENIQGAQHLHGDADDLRLRMAKAMCEQDGFAWDAASPNQTAHGAPPEQQRRYWLDKADAALAAMVPHHGKLTLAELDEIIEGRAKP
ncbi:hypothetical protein [Rhizobium sp. SSA_523]|uniref:hypothetical protein n=1 Tax=Rhizobium sp. SSA_523 TaxID=2952477 RepID=UPI00209182DD|nr:hypothetical protein [Rhizobium sp. SSA_523]MCO5730121.1 hypothetical protein [Rhizobium sp. SSA_523]WKC25186.1 hypothetical protein QTJ18_14455 [Rhizobium sp. SSA_523]